MKFDFWFDLPRALTDISRELLSKEELDLCEFINLNSKVYNHKKISLIFHIYKLTKIFKINEFQLIHHL